MRIISYVAIEESYFESICETQEMSDCVINRKGIVLIDSVENEDE